MFCLQNKKEGMVSDYSDSFVSSQNRSLYATCSSWHIDPFYFPRNKFLARKSIKVSFFAAKAVYLINSQHINTNETFRIILQEVS